MTSRRSKRRPKRVKPGAKVSRGPMADYGEEPRGRTRRSSRRAGGGGGSQGPPVPLIVGGAVVGVVLLIGLIFALSGGGASGSGGSGGARKAAKAYMAAWKSGDVDTLVELEHLSRSDAESLCSEYQRHVAAVTSAKRIPTKARGEKDLDRIAILEMGDPETSGIDFNHSDKVALARKIIAVAYKIYFGEGKPSVSYEVKGVEADGDQATVRLTLSVSLGKEGRPPALVPLAAMGSSGRLSLVRVDGKWKISRR